MATRKQLGVEFDVTEFDGEEPLPLDTVGGIMQRISAVNAKSRKDRGRPRQCPSTFTTGKRTLNTTFCTLDEEHEGEHRGYRKRWPNTKPVPPTSTSDVRRPLLPQCTCTDHRPDGDVRCIFIAVYRLEDEDGEALLCSRHAEAVVDMYEPGQIRRLRDGKPIGGGR